MVVFRFRANVDRLLQRVFVDIEGAAVAVAAVVAGATLLAGIHMLATCLLLVSSLPEILSREVCESRRFRSSASASIVGNARGKSCRKSKRTREEGIKSEIESSERSRSSKAYWLVRGKSKVSDARKHMIRSLC